ncbi:MAG: CocE/NonD family hydrolase [Chloroflexota bacterium]
MKEGSVPRYKMKVERNVFAPMRDGVKIALDIYRPDAEGKFPALLGMCPYTKEKQSLNVPPHHFNPDYAGNEKGDSEYFVSRGYVHAVADVRGSGSSEGKFDIMARKEQEDGYDVIEWLAQQPWCDGNVGMVGISYLAIIQYLVAAQQPPHLKAIFPHDGWGDMYRDISHHGGILMNGWLARFTSGRQHVHLGRGTGVALPLLPGGAGAPRREAEEERGYQQGQLSLRVPELSQVQADPLRLAGERGGRSLLLGTVRLYQV